MELMDYTVNSEYKSFPLYKYERKLYVPGEDHRRLDLRICRAGKPD